MSVKFKADLIAYRVEEKKIDKLIKAYVNRKRSKTMAKIKILMTNYL
jgi:hypothetical protein